MPIVSNIPFESPIDSLREELTRRVAAGEGDTFLYLAPNRRAQKRIERELVLGMDGGALGAMPVLTLSDMTRALGAVAFRNVRVLSDAESAIFIEQTIRALLQDGALKYFERQREMPDTDRMSASGYPLPRGTFELIVNTLREIEERGTSPEELGREIAEASRLRGDRTEILRARDIHLIYSGYRTRLGSEFADGYSLILRLRDRYRTSLESLRTDIQEAFPNVSDIYLDGFVRLEDPVLELLSSMRRIGKIRIAVTLELERSNSELFAPVVKLEEQLLERGWSEIHSVDRESRSDAAAVAAKRLFNSNDTQEPQRVSDVSVAAARNPLDEIEEIAKTIKRIFADDPKARLDLSKIVVALPFPQEYTGYVHEVFSRHGIPALVADRYHLDRSPILTSLLALFEIAQHGLRRRDVLRALTSPFLEFRLTSDDTLDAANLLDIVSRYRLSGDVKGWIAGLRGELDRILDEEDELDLRLDGAARDLTLQDSITRAMSDLRHLDRMLAPLREEMTPAAFCKIVRGFLARLHVQERIVASSSATIAAGSLELDSRAYRALQKLIEDLESLFVLLGISGEKKPLAFYIERLKAASIYTRYNPRVRPGTVLVTSLDQAATQPCDHIFIAGLNEGALPSAYEPQIFLMHSMQTGAKGQLEEERLVFYRAIAAASQQVYLSYPTRGMSGSKKTKSRFIDALSDVMHLKASSSAGPLDLYSYQDVYRLAGLSEQLVADSSARLLTGSARALPTSGYATALRVHVPRALAAERLRVQHRDSVFRGSVGEGGLSEHEREALARNSTRVWSVTQLETYASCGFKYFSKQVLRLDRTEDQEEGLDAREQGTLMHEVLREFLTARRELGDGHALADLTDAGVSEAFDEVVLIAEKHLGKGNELDPVRRIDSERLLGRRNQKESPLYRFIEKERSLSKYESRPSFFEVSFGDEGRRRGRSEQDPTLSHEEPVIIDGIRLRGKIDRIDRSAGTFTIIDYKTGNRLPGRKDIDRGTALQLPLYLRVAEDLLRSHEPELEGVAALYHKVLDKKADRKLGLAIGEYMDKNFEKFRKQGGLLESPDELKALIDEVVKKTKTYVENISQGRFPLVSKDLTSTCEHCAYRSVCRVSDAEDLGLLREP